MQESSSTSFSHALAKILLIDIRSENSCAKVAPAKRNDPPTTQLLSDMSLNSTVIAKTNWTGDKLPAERRYVRSVSPSHERACLWGVPCCVGLLLAVREPPRVCACMTRYLIPHKSSLSCSPCHWVELIGVAFARHDRSLATPVLFSCTIFLLIEQTVIEYSEPAVIPSIQFYSICLEL